MDQDFDIIIVGAGLVGTSVAIALQSLQKRIGILETHLPLAVSAPAADTRPLALNYSSQIILQTLGLWNDLQPLATPIKSVHVSEQRRIGSLHFQAQQEKVPALGYVVPAGELHQTLYQQAARQSGVEILSIQNLSSIHNSNEGVNVRIETMQGQKTLRGALLIGADGTHSTTRQLLNIHSQAGSTQEVAMTALIQHREQHHYTAYERFTDQGILALLPLKNGHQSRLVWTLAPSLAEEMEQWDETYFASVLEKKFAGRFSGLKIIERGKQYPLQVILAEEQIRPGVVLLGNAAHTLFPLAAQGFNLGLRDAATLAEVLTTANSERQALGELTVLEKYLQWRLSDQQWMSHLTSGVNQLFGLQLPLLATARSAGLLALDLLPPLKRRLAKRLMGLSGRLPKLAMGIGL